MCKSWGWLQVMKGDDLSGSGGARSRDIRIVGCAWGYLPDDLQWEIIISHHIGLCYEAAWPSWTPPQPPAPSILTDETTHGECQQVRKAAVPLKCIEIPIAVEE